MSAIESTKASAPADVKSEQPELAASAAEGTFSLQALVPLFHYQLTYSL
jgi:hypothetical protein